MHGQRPVIEARVYKWPRRPQTAGRAYLLGEDEFGRWLGTRQGDPWWAVDGSRSGVYVAPLVKLVVEGAYWSVCFQPIDPVVDVDIVLPARWGDEVFEEVDLELDVLRLADGRVVVRDREEFERLRTEWGLPAEIAVRAEETAAWVRGQLKEGAEPFARAGGEWLSRWMDEVSGSEHIPSGSDVRPLHGAQ